MAISCHVSNYEKPADVIHVTQASFKLYQVPAFKMVEFLDKSLM